MLLQKVERGAEGWGEGCGLARLQEGLQQRSEWPKILHSAVHAHSPREEERERLEKPVVTAGVNPHHQ